MPSSTDSGLTEPVVLTAQQRPRGVAAGRWSICWPSSRYCDTERTSPTVAWNLFGSAVSGWAHVQSVSSFRLDEPFARSVISRLVSDQDCLGSIP